MRILVIDDDEQMRIMLRNVIEWIGYDVLEAENGRQGMRTLRSNEVDMVITDLIMPDQEGLETIKMIKKQYGDLKIIAISGGGRIGPDAYLPAALELGADRIFSKPFDIKKLVDAIEELFADAAS